MNIMGRLEEGLDKELRIVEGLMPCPGQNNSRFMSAGPGIVGGD